MHPDPLYRQGDRALFEDLIEQIGFGMVFAATPDGPRVVHTPLLSTGDGAVQFHISRGNALFRHLDGATGLIVVNGPDGYVSPRWYANRDTVPTWDYVALEIEGRVRRMADEGLEAFLHALIARHEGRLPGAPWRAEECSPAVWNALFRAVAGFELEVQAFRPTLKLSQHTPAADRAAVAEGLEAAGSPALAHLMRTFAS